MMVDDGYTDRVFGTDARAAARRADRWASLALHVAVLVIGWAAGWASCALWVQP